MGEWMVGKEKQKEKGCWVVGMIMDRVNYIYIDRSFLELFSMQGSRVYPRYIGVVCTWMHFGEIEPITCFKVCDSKTDCVYRTKVYRTNLCLIRQVQ